MSESRVLDSWYGLWMRVKGPHNYMIMALGSCVKRPSCMWVLFGSFFMFSDLYQLDLHNKTCVASTNLQCNINKTWIKKSNLPLI